MSNSMTHERPQSPRASDAVIDDDLSGAVVVLVAVGGGVEVHGGDETPIEQVAEVVARAARVLRV